MELARRQGAVVWPELFRFEPIVTGGERRSVRQHSLIVSFDRLELNPVPNAAGTAVAALFPDDPPAYMERGPFSYAEPALIERDLRGRLYPQPAGGRLP